MVRRKIVIIGAGNVATHLAIALQEKCHVTQVYSKHIEHATRLSSKLQDCQPISSPNDINRWADFYIIAVSDDAIAEVANAMPKVDGIVAHTSGSVPLGAIAPASVHTGVFYPLQTFSKDTPVDMASVPFFIEASDAGTFAQLFSLAETISESVHSADSEKRAALHLAAVFGCNFANHLWAKSEEILGRQGLSLDVLRPLLEATLQKAMSMPPRLAQTGPAARGDINTIKKHIAMLSDDDAKIYSLISKSISDSINKPL